MWFVNLIVGFVIFLNAVIGFIAIADAKAYDDYIMDVPTGDLEFHSYNDFPLWVYFVFPIAGLMYGAYLWFVRIVNAIIN